MFNNISGKIKTSAKIVFVLGMILDIVIAIVFFCLSVITPIFILVGIIFLIIGIALPAFISIIVYGFGIIVANYECGDENNLSSKAVKANSQARENSYSEVESQPEYTEPIIDEDADKIIASLNQMLICGQITQEEFDNEYDIITQKVSEKVCSNCGAVLKENAKFCQKCGVETE